MSSSGRRVLTQSEMQEARSHIDFCYVCGNPLPQRGPGFRKQVVGEHVVPRNLLGQPPRRDAWAVVLDMHPACEETAKRVDDDLLSVLQKINTNDRADWPDAGHVRNLDFEMVVATIGDGSRGIPAFGNAEPVLKGAWTWIRGLHAALYGEFLPAEADHCAFPSVPACSTTGGITMQDAEEHGFVCREAVRLGVRRGKWDGVVAWGSRLSYRCVWKHVPPEYGGPTWFCFWGLLFPGVLEWSRTVLPPGHERPWRGHYASTILPNRASILVQDDIAETRG